MWIDMKRTILSVLMLCALCVGVCAQEVAFTADRPGASTGTSVLGQGVLQLEQGVEFQRESKENTFTFSNTLVRYGLCERMELRIGGDGFMCNNESKKECAFSGISLGTKISCYEGKGAIPAVSVLADFVLPNTASSGFETKNLAPSLYLLFDNPINEKLNIGYNVGAEWDGESASPAAFVALCLGVSANDKFGYFVEGYKYFPDKSYYADFGANVMVARNVQLDIAANINVGNPSKYWAISFGVVWQINK